ncbi:glutathione S-transferase family protein [Legionella dresdenensis]|uniref:Glutathione S-transferase family protein n=1 Tax=Legionella dresdenensis TaxID=450200 RepID=A0ABV8CHJ6_9GAMM
MITLYQFPSVWGLPNASPFCMKIETYLRMVELPYENRYVMDPRKSPKGKFPYIKIDGQPVADSELIIQFLKQKFGDSLDKGLTEQQKASAVVLDAMLSERLYWLILYSRWYTETGWAYVKPAYFSRLPALAKLFVPKAVRKKMLQALFVQGTGRHTAEEIAAMTAAAVDALAVILGEQSYFMGDEPTSIDASAFAFLANIVWQPFEDQLKASVLKHKNLYSYCERMWCNFYPEMKLPG